MKTTTFLASRRSFVQRLALGLGGVAVSLPWLQQLASAAPAPEAATLPPAQAERKLGIALVGLGGYSKGQLAPALLETKQCYLAGIVTGSAEKVPEWRQKYNIPEQNVYSYETFDQNVYDYKTFDRMIDNPAIDIVYVVLPNALHAEYVIRAAKAGKHVICEKPMATSVEDCRRMIAACRTAGKKLGIGYRLHHDPHNLEMMRLGQQQVYGPVKKIVADNGFSMGKDERPWRIQKKLSGGGPLMDMGIYCVQGMLYTKGQLPVSVTASYPPKTRPAQFNEVEEAVNWQFKFADGSVADGRTSYTENMGRLRAEATKGWFELQPAFGYGGLKGTTSKGKMPQENVNQQARQMDDFAACVRQDKPTRVPGEMGLRDVQLLLAIYRAANTKQSVSTKDVINVATPTGKG